MLKVSPPTDAMRALQLSPKILTFVNTPAPDDLGHLLDLGT